ncbi:MAG: hypothetical protein ABIT10_01220 [Alteraurantiacibacter sp.]
MRKILATLAAATMLAGGAVSVQAETRQERSEARLAEMLEGYTAGEPVSCIYTTRSNRLTVMERIGLVYDAGEVIYVARAVHPNMLDSEDVPVIERFSSQLCVHDVMRTIDRNSPSFQGALFLEDFVPYTRVDNHDG